MNTILLKTQIALALGLLAAARRAKAGGLNRKEAVNVMRGAVKKYEVRASNSDVRRAVEAVYHE